MNMNNIINPDTSIFHKLVQIGIVVKNIEKTTGFLKTLFNWDVLSFAETPEGVKYYHGEPEDFCVNMAFYRFNNIEIELLEPVRGKNVWQDHLDSVGEGIHHIMFDVNSFVDAKKCLEDQGIKMVQNGPSARYKGCQWAYFDATKELGYHIEIINQSEFGY